MVFFSQFSIGDVGGGIAAIAGCVGVWVALRAPEKAAELTTAKLEGTILTRLDAHNERIEKIETEQIRQWESLENHTRSIAHLQGHMERRSKARGAGA